VRALAIGGLRAAAYVAVLWLTHFAIVATAAFAVAFISEPGIGLALGLGLWGWAAALLVGGWFRRVRRWSGLAPRDEGDEHVEVFSVRA